MNANSRPPAAFMVWLSEMAASVVLMWVTKLRKNIQVEVLMLYKIKSVTFVKTLLFLLVITTPFETMAQNTKVEEAKALKLNRREEQWSAAQKAKNSGDFAAAIKSGEVTLELDRSLLGVDHSQLISTIAFLADCEAGRQNWKASKAKRTEVLTRSIKAFGEKDYRVADARQALTHLGIVEKLTAEQRDQLADADAREIRANRFYREGNYPAAIKLTGEVLVTREKILGPEYPDAATSLNNLASMYHSQANYVAAEPLYQRALKINEKALGPEHPDTATSLNNLAMLYKLQENYAEAEPLLQRALKINEKSLGPEHPDTAKCLNNLAEFYRFQKKYSTAEPLYVRALKINEKVLGPEHPDTANSLCNLALLYESRANYPSAEPLLRRALKIREKSLGPKHPGTANSLNNLALFLWRHADERQAAGLAARTIEVVRNYLERTATIQSEQQQLLMAKEHVATHLWLTVTTQDANGSDCWNHFLPWKGITTSRQALLRRALGHDPLFIEYRRVTQQLSTVMLSPPQPRGNLEAIAAWRNWEAEKERLEIAHTDLEKQLATKSAAFGQNQRRQRVTANEITAALRAQDRPTALVDLEIYLYIGRDAREGREKELDEYRLAAFIARPDREVQRVELGASVPLLQLIDTWTRFFGQGDEGRVAGEQLRKRLWQPLEEKLEGIETVLISPDGALARLPWGALPGAKPGHYLIEERGLAIIPIPQFLPELVQLPAHAGPPESLLSVGDIDYGGDPGKPADLLTKREALGRNGRDGRLMKFEKLPGSQPEMASIERRYRKAKTRGELTSLDSLEATEAAFRELAEKHQWLHVITHGYFAPETVNSAMEPLAIAKLTTAETRPRPLVHPGLLSGLAMSGANHEFQTEQGDKDDGILTAMEVSGLDLQKVDTVVLSACETGLGQVAGGEGLLGLQRAFMVAGAKTTVASLWKVPDAATARLMQRFYENLWGKKMGKLEALREAQIWMLRDQGNRGLTITEQPADKESLPPYYWAAFVLSGNWR